MTASIDASMDASAITNLPTSLLHHELLRRQQTTPSSNERPACGSSGTSRTYNTPLHVFALFLILFLSTLACSFPVIVRRFPHLPVPNYALFLSRHFGTGVLIATAFVHLLPTAYTSLTDPCLPRFWTEVYPAMSGFIAMVSVMVVVGIEMVFAMQGATHSHSLDLAGLRGDGGKERARGEGYRAQRPMGLRTEEEEGLEEHGAFLDAESPRKLDKPLPPEPPFEDDDSDLDLDELDPINEDERPLNGRLKKASLNGAARPGRIGRQVSFAELPESPDPELATSPTDQHNEQRLVLQCLMLEAGILFHSVFIGMALSVSTGSAFVVLLIAICFHQTFEGLALGSRIAAINSFSTTSLKPWIMSFMYGVTTPVGQAIGLAVHTLYDPNSQFGLLMVGIVNAISAGLLLYAGLVQLLAEDFLSEHSYHELQGRQRLEACGAVVCGSMLMAFVGAFA